MIAASATGKRIQILRLTLSLLAVLVALALGACSLDGDSKPTVAAAATAPTQTAEEASSEPLPSSPPATSGATTSAATPATPAAAPAPAPAAPIAYSDLPLSALPPGGTAPLHLQAIVVQGAKPIKDPIIWTVVVPAANGQPAQAIARVTKAQPKLDLPPGNYIVEANWNGARIEKKVLVQAGKTRTEVLNFNAGTITMKMIPHTGAAAISNPVQWEVYPHLKGAGQKLDPATRVASVSAPSQSFVLPAGNYIIRASYGGATADLVAPVEAGITYKYTINLYAGKIGFSANSQAADILWQVYRAKPEQDGTHRLIATQTGAAPSFLLREGRYYVVATAGGKTGQSQFEVFAGNNAKVKVTLQ